jgi:hypothetical protein
MTPPTTVLQFTAMQKNALTTALQNANTTLTAKQTALAARTKTRDDTKAQLAGIAADMAAVRKQLAATVTPEDGAAFLLQLQADITNSRTTSAALADAERAAAVAKAEADVAASEVQRITAALAAATAAWKDAQIQDKRRKDLKAALAAPPLSTIAADAGAAAAGAAFTKAKTRLETNLPVALKTQAEERLSTETARAAASLKDFQDAQAALEAKHTADGGVAGAVWKLQNAFQRADAAFTAYATGALDHLNQANALLAKIGDPTVSPLTPAQAARIEDATLVGNAITAATAEAAKNDAAVQVAQKQEALDEAIRQALSTDVDADPAVDPGVVAATTALGTTQTALTTAQAAYTPTLVKQARDWEAVVPDPTWQLLADFEKARSLLTDLQTPGPTALTTAMDAAEGALVTSLIAADKSARTLAALQAEADEREAIASYETAASAGRRFNAVRGDF